jgi:hypothetical protein
MMGTLESVFAPPRKFYVNNGVMRLGYLLKLKLLISFSAYYFKLELSAITRERLCWFLRKITTIACIAISAAFVLEFKKVIENLADQRFFGFSGG